MNRWTRLSAGIPALLLAACVDQGPVHPRPDAPGGAARSLSGTQRGLPAPVSNRTKYGDAGQRPSTGRSGSATLTVRALLARDRTVELAVTTGAEDGLDAGTGPGRLDKVQVKALDPGGNRVSTVNHTGLRSGGFASFAVRGLLRGSRVQVQAHVSGIDPRRTDVVTVTEPVRLRPDLVARELVAPAEAAVGVPVSIGATVLEANGDVGARADCVLRVDGAEVDRAAGIWVDARGSVSCAFTHAFAVPGARSLAVSVAGVVPGDYDPASNEVVGTITVVEASAREFFSSAFASDARTSSFYRERGWWEKSYDEGATWHRAAWDSDVRFETRYQAAVQSGRIDEEIAYPMTVRVRQASNGRDIVDWTVPLPAEDRIVTSADSRSACAYRATQTPEAGRLWMQVCSGSYTDIGGVTHHRTEVQQNRWAGEVTYFGREYYETWYGDTRCPEGDCYTHNWGEGTVRSSEGMPLPALGPDYTLETVVSKDGARHASRVTVPLEPFSTSARWPYTGEECGEWDHLEPGYIYRTSGCTVSGQSETGVRGSGFAAPAW